MNQQQQWQAGFKCHNSDPEKAIEHYLKAIELEPHPYLYTNIANCYKKLNNLEQEFHYYKLAAPLLLALDNRYDGAPYNGCAWSLYEHNLFDEALELVTIALEISPSNCHALDTHARILIKLNRADEIIPSIAKLLHFDPDFEAAADLIEQYRAEATEWLEEHREQIDYEVLIEAAFAKYDTGNYYRNIRDYYLKRIPRPVQNYFYNWSNVLTDLYNNLVPLDHQWMKDAYEIVLNGHYHNQLFDFFKKVLPLNRFKEIPPLLSSTSLPEDELITLSIRQFNQEQLAELIPLWIDEDETKFQKRFQSLNQTGDLLPFARELLKRDYENSIEPVINKALSLPENNNILPVLKLIKEDEKVATTLSLRVENWLKSRGAELSEELIEQIGGCIEGKTPFDALQPELLKLQERNLNLPFYSLFLDQKLDASGYTRALQIGLYLDPVSFFQHQLHLKQCDDTTLKKDLEQYSIPVAVAARVFMKRFSNGYDPERKQLKKLLPVLLERDYEITISILKRGLAEGVSKTVKPIWSFDPQRGIDTLLQYGIELNSKQVRGEILSCLANHEPAHEKIKALVTHKKAPVRTFGVQLLGTFNHEDDLQFLKGRLDVEKSKTVKVAIDAILGQTESITINNNPEDLGSEFQRDALKYTMKGSKEPVSGIQWLNVATLPKPLWLTDQRPFTQEEIYALIDLFARGKLVMINPRGEQLKKSIEPESLQSFVDTCLSRWNQDSKSKWMIALAAILGGDPVISVLNELIKKFVNRNRGAMAAHVVNGIALIGSPKALQRVYMIGQKERNKQVRRAGNSALDFAAQNLNISREELMDRIIPDFGLSGEGTLELSYGTRSFKITLAPDLSLTILNLETNKVVKNLPKPGKKDDETVAKASKEHFKELKKGIKEQIKLQTERLDNTLSMQRFWSVEQWQTLFINNPLMRRFATTLIWGLYEMGHLKTAFRYQEDGSFCDAEEDEITLPEGGQITLVHPMELTDDQLKQWVEQLDDYEIIQPVQQLNRPIHTVNPDMKNPKELDDFQGFMITRVALKRKLYARGWRNGPVQDAGCFYEYIKELPDGTRIELNFMGDCMGGYYDFEEVPVYKINCYRGGDTVPFTALNPRTYSELYHEIKTVVESGSGYYEDWESVSW